MNISIKSIILLLFYIINISNSVLDETNGLDGVLLCQANCNSDDRLFGPIKPPDTRTHPWKVAQFPSTTTAFCKLGCQYFFSYYSNNNTCINQCKYQYRYQATTGYSDSAELAKLECLDGCNIALSICQAGYYCVNGNMTVCPAGKYRESVSDLSLITLEKVHTCINCPYGRYRALDKGRSANDCSKCPVGKYANVTGSVKESDCQRCPAGKFADEEGSRYCKCITTESCDMVVDIGGKEETFYKDGVDYYRESVPYIGRW